MCLRRQEENKENDVIQLAEVRILVLLSRGLIIFSENYRMCFVICCQIFNDFQNVTYLGQFYVSDDNFHSRSTQEDTHRFILMREEIVLQRRAEELQWLLLAGGPQW